MKLATYNVNGVTSRLPNLLAWLETARPDVVCLQELKTTEEKFPRAALERAGYGAVCKGQKNWNGVAILARGAEPLETRRKLPGDPDPHQARYIEAAVGGVLVACLYAPNGNPVGSAKFAFKELWYERFMGHAEVLRSHGLPAVLAGDFNIIPTDRDVYAPQRWRDDALFQPALKDSYLRLVGSGWRDTLREAYPDQAIYTFWKYWRNSFQRDAGLRIDHILVSPSLGGRVRKAGVDRGPRGAPGSSDHTPVWVELDLAGLRSI
ncbi:MAG: exodeoxyribonuclease III [Proteobacteria bacterium]|nr:exodeoxyribonuclease III [Pseudomonadota bacterium]